MIRRLLPYVIFLTCNMFSGLVAAQDHSQGRSMVITRGGIVASEHPLASQAAATLLAEGGHAVDAAIAANAVMGVVAPMWNGIGGDLFAIVYDAETDSLQGLHANGWSPAGLSLETLRSGDAEHPSGIHGVTVPGTVAGWEALRQRFGRKPLAQLLAPAIRYAREGFPVAELNAAIWAMFADRVRDDDNARRLYLPGGRAPVTGELFRTPDLAWTLQQIADKGIDAFYRGAVTQRILAYSKSLGGKLAMDDFAAYQPEWVTPLSTEYRGWAVYELPAPTQGVAALAMLNILETFPLQDFGHNSAAALHRLIESKKLAYADMQANIGDGHFSAQPYGAMLAKDYAKNRASLIDPQAARCDVPAGLLPEHGGDTTYLSVVDRDGNMVSLIQSVFYPFGSGLVAEGTGFVLQNRGELFSLEEGHPNVYAPRKRPLHTIIPGFMSRGETKIAFGIMGGWNQAQAHAQFVSNIVDHGMNIQAAMEAARFSKWSFAGCDLMIEARVPAAVRDELTALGHELTLRGDYSGFMGAGQAVLRDFNQQVNYGASDPRKDGAAIPEPLTRKK